MTCYNFGGRQMWASAALTAPPVAKRHRRSLAMRSIRLCEVCKTSFRPISSQKNPRFCSRTCYNAANAARQQTFVCIKCGKQFQRSEANLRWCKQPPKHCSASCRRAEVSFRSRKRGSHRPVQSFDCLLCGSQFEVAQSELKRRTPKYCSLDCANRAKRLCPDNPRYPLTAEDRQTVLRKTDGRCWYCGSQLGIGRQYHVDHYVPRAAGGSHRIGNLVPACAQCNTAKGALPLEEFRAKQGVVLFWFELQDYQQLALDGAA